MALVLGGTRDRLSIPCDIESRLPTAQRRARLHQECPDGRCTCPAHERDERQADR